MTNPENTTDETNNDNLHDIVAATEQTYETAQEQALKILRDAPSHVRKGAYVWEQIDDAQEDFELASDLVSNGETVDVDTQDPSITERVKKYYNIIKNMSDDEKSEFEDKLEATVKESASNEFDQIIASWNNPTGLFKERVALTHGGPGALYRCSQEGCSHTYTSNIAVQLYIDNGKGDINFDVKYISLDAQSEHFLEEHPTTEKAITDARAIIGQHEQSIRHSQPEA